MMLGDHDDSFIWQDYLEATGTKAVPHALFTHVERSLASGLRPGTVVEVPDRSGGGYWPCSLTLACGPLLRVRPLGLGPQNTALQFWCDPDKVRVHPPGWGAANGLQLLPPPELLSAAGDDADVGALQRAAAEEAQQAAAAVTPVTEELLAGDGFIPVDRIKQGMKVEVQDRINPYLLWVATIVENVGGRLLLRYDTPDSNFPDFWLFYSSPRLFRMGFAEENGSPWRLRWPKTDSQQQQQHRSSEEWHAILEMSRLEDQRMPLPPDLLQNRVSVPLHGFKVGMKLEALDPKTHTDIRPATVARVFDENYFLIRIDGCGPDSIGTRGICLCTADHPYIFPAGWCEENGITLSPPRGWQSNDGETFSWVNYLSKMPGVETAPTALFPPRRSASEMGFCQGAALEAVDPNNPDRVCAATIANITQHLLWIRLESEPRERSRQYVVNIDSLDIFPVGWCESNSYPLKPPRSFSTPVPVRQPAQVNIPKSVEAKPSTSVPATSSGNGSSWCPKIYFNHKCFSGPYLSKGKLSGLPKSVGPGPVTLVLKEVLSMVISVAYKSSRVLKELQCDSKQPPHGHVLEVLKAKYKNNTYRANVAVVTSADEVTNFCKRVCRRLQVCPYLFGPIAIGENVCPEKCNTQSKTKFTHYWVHGKRKIGRPKGEASIVVPRPRKRRGRVAARINAAWRKLTSTASNSSQLLSHESLQSTVTKTQQQAEDKTIRESSNASDTGTIIDSDTSVPKKDLKTPTAPGNHHQTSSSIRLLVPSRRKENDSEEDEIGYNSKHIKLFNYHLNSNPLYWTEDDLHHYLVSTGECAPIADKFKEEMIDGQAFMMLNLPTLEKHLFMQPDAALMVCRHIERVKLAFLLQYYTKRQD
ncbi:scm-like with four MBT domains protein 1 [Schistocerca americana]|uniref:scm-like with four MBT domains protein 1 n=1 Tax=Schistocerca americana TaxID=7009 RepID=UPI001F4F7AEE|nr:scm-like with four MBT domains protein 1 [Schistocerca americana]